MILLDANVLVYGHDEDSPHHAIVSQWLEEAMTRREDVGLPWVVILAFLRLMTNPAAFRQPYSLDEALGIVDSYLSRSHVTVVQPTPEHWRIFGEISREAQITHRLVTDAHLAALTIERGAELCTTDRDFRRFKGLRTIDPLVRQ